MGLTVWTNCLTAAAHTRRARNLHEQAWLSAQQVALYLSDKLYTRLLVAFELASISELHNVNDKASE